MPKCADPGLFFLSRMMEVSCGRFDRFQPIGCYFHIHSFTIPLESKAFIVHKVNYIVRGEPHSHTTL